MTTPDRDQEQPLLRITTLVPTHPYGFGDHEFEYSTTAAAAVTPGSAASTSWSTRHPS